MRDDQLNIKSLALELGVSLHYFYEMRRCGFQLRGFGAYNKTATLAEAREWIQSNGFKLKDGVGVVRKRLMTT